MILVRIYVTGGSQGSEFINKNVPLALNALNMPTRGQASIWK